MTTFMETQTEMTRGTAASSAPSSFAYDVPAAQDYAQYPPSWYPFCLSSDLGKKPIFRKMLGKELVAFRGESGRVTVISAYCAHLGANLAGGCVKGDSIECPYHGWRFGQDGACIEIPGQEEIPKFAQQRAYPTLERHGMIFFYNGKQPAFDLPFFEAQSPAGLIAGGHFEFEVQSPWYMMASHAFDERHIAHVHDRQLLGELAIDEPTPHSRRSRHESLVVGDSIFDRLLRIFVGPRVRISMTTYHGVFVVVEGIFARAHSRFMLMITPLESGNCKVTGRIFIRPVGIAPLDRLLSPLRFGIRRWFTEGYLVAENESIGHHSYRPFALGPQDDQMKGFFRWVHRVTRVSPDA